MSNAWFCPSCQKYHAPHVETCPGGAPGKFTMPLIPGPFDTPIAKPKCSKCGLIFDGAMSYCCPDLGCPSGFGGSVSITVTGAVQ